MLYRQFQEYRSFIGKSYFYIVVDVVGFVVLVVNDQIIVRYIWVSIKEYGYFNYRYIYLVI